MSYNRIPTLAATFILVAASACTLELGSGGGDGGGGTMADGGGATVVDGGGENVGGGEEAPVAEVAEVSLIGITPADDFAESGLVTFTLLPKDAAGEPVIDDRLVVDAPVTLGGLTADVQEVTTREPEEGKAVSAFINLDSSGSMIQSDPNELRKDAAKQFVDALAPDDLVAVGDFGMGATDPFDHTRLLTDFTTDRTAIDAAVDEVMAAGGTPMYGSLLEVLDFYGTAGPTDVSRSIVLLGDGQPTGTGTLEDVCASAQAAQIPLNTIGLGPAADASPSADPDAVKVLRDLADCSGGAYTGVVEASDLGEAFDGFGQATSSGAVVVTVRFSPIPAAGSEIGGDLDVGSPDQVTPITVTYDFVAP